MSLPEDVDGIHSRQGFGQRIGYGDAAAVVIVDFQVGLTTAAGPIGSSSISDAVDRSVDLINAAAEVSIPIYHVRTVYRRDATDAGVFRYKARTPTLLVEGSDHAEFDPRIPFRDDDVEVVKKMPSAFFGTPLSMFLTERRVDTCIVIGCVTSGCIRATAVDGMSHGYRIVVPAECVGDREDAAHRQSLLDMQRKCADVRPREEVIDWLRSR